MVKGIEQFKAYFETFPDNYIIIGGTACDMIMEDEGLKARATKDIDIILVVEALSPEFLKTFWQFIKDGNYNRKEKSNDERQYYRFLEPENDEFPQQIELFSRNPDLIDLDPDTHLTPIPVDDDLSSLSAILLDDTFYQFIVQHSVVVAGIHRANTEAIIVLKAKAYLDIAGRIAQGVKEDSKHLKKHKNDIFKLAMLFNGEERFELPQSIKDMFIAFLKLVKNELPTPDVFKAMGMKGATSEVALNAIKSVFNLTDVDLA
ncbi:hypothetical protein [Sphingobacterium yanglingense]|uniref:Nucleotidyltransferase AbiEii toxin of type IV toxin-antitoxin system n=1 Tax=Sphingobacterium yanglingense TaxID=1437280 RepID=A0A4R6WPX3_9SPHI|nr:hypothetical protein [Sphingobacterium yanglingense]TDQ78335.1 hypothetical protein CLV99_2318 [Sphingobacterium yanglingense]